MLRSQDIVQEGRLPCAEESSQHLANGTQQLHKRHGSECVAVTGIFPRARIPTRRYTSGTTQKAPTSDNACFAASV